MLSSPKTSISLLSYLQPTTYQSSNICPTNLSKMMTNSCRGWNSSCSNSQESCKPLKNTKTPKSISQILSTTPIPSPIPYNSTTKIQDFNNSANKSNNNKDSELSLKTAPKESVIAVIPDCTLVNIIVHVSEPRNRSVATVVLHSYPTEYPE